MTEIIDGKAVWKGVVKFGMVALPVYLRSMDNDKTPEFHKYRRKDMSRVRMKSVSEKDGAEVTNAEIIKGVDMGDRVIPFEPEEIAALKVASNKLVQIDSFVNKDDVLANAIAHMGTSYIIVPDKVTEPYAILQEALRQANKVGIGRITIRDREKPVVIQPYGNGIIVTMLAYDDEIIRPENISGLQGITEPPEEAVSLAIALIEGMAEDFDISTYHNTVRAKFDEMLAAKMKGKKIKVAPVAASAPAPGQDIVAVLKASLAAKKAEKPKKKVAVVKAR